MISIAGACVVEGSRMLLVRKRGQAFWILAGGKLEADETPEQAVEREIDEELGVRFVPDGTHTVWEDDAGGAPGVRVRVHLHGGSILGEPVCQAEIEEVAMIDVSRPTVPVAPSLARQIMPWIANRVEAEHRVTDAVGPHDVHRVDADGNLTGSPTKAVFDGAWSLVGIDDADLVGAVPGLHFVFLPSDRSLWPSSIGNGNDPSMTDERTSSRKTHGTKTVFAPFDDCGPDSVAEGIDTLIERAIDELAENGYVPVGPVSIAPASWHESIYVEGSHRDDHTRHSGIVATITYTEE